jgi:hypothetical protein
LQDWDALEGNLLLHGREQAQQAEAKAKQAEATAEQAEAKAAQERRKNEQLMAKLRELGVDPESLP